MIRLFLGAIAGVAVILFFAFWFAPGGALAAPMRCGTASWYGTESGTRTATGEHFTGNDLTAAMPSRSHLGERYRVHFGHRSVDVRVNDVGPALRLHRIMDLSRAAAERIGLIGRGVGTVCVEQLP